MSYFFLYLPMIITLTHYVNEEKSTLEIIHYNIVLEYPEVMLAGLAQEYITPRHVYKK